METAHREAYDFVFQGPMSWSLLYSLADQPEREAMALLTGKGMRLDSAELLASLQPSWPPNHPLKNQDFSAAPYWLTRGATAQPVYDLSELSAVICQLKDLA